MPGDTGLGREYRQLDPSKFGEDKDPKNRQIEDLNRILRQLYDRLDALEGRRGTVELGADIDLNENRVTNSADAVDDGDLVSKGFAEANYGPIAMATALSLAGTNPLNVSGLRGQLFQAQPAAAPIGNVNVILDTALDGTLFVENNVLYRVDASVSPAVAIAVSGLAVVSEGLYAARPAAADTAIGTLFFATDRNIAWIVVDSGGNVWHYFAGIQRVAVASLPTPTADDAGYQVYTTDTLTHYIWTGIAWTTIGGLYQVITNAATTAVTDLEIRQHLLTAPGNGGDGIGVGRLDQTKDDANTIVDAVRTFSKLTIAAAATVTSSWGLQLRSAGAALADWFEVLVDGIRFNVGGFFGKFTHAAGANVVWTMPAATGNIPYETAALTNNNFLFGGGGALLKDAGFAIIPVANGGTGVDNSTQTYTPTHSALTNLDTTTPSLTSYYRVGNVVTVAGGFSADPTAAGACSFEMSLPVASNFANTFEAGGVSTLLVGGEDGGISAVVANDTLLVQWVAAGTADAAYTFTVSYRVI